MQTITMVLCIVITILMSDFGDVRTIPQTELRIGKADAISRWQLHSPDFALLSHLSMR